MAKPCLHLITDQPNQLGLVVNQVHLSSNSVRNLIDILWKSFNDFANLKGMVGMGLVCAGIPEPGQRGRTAASQRGQT